MTLKPLNLSLKHFLKLNKFDKSQSSVKSKYNLVPNV